MTRPGSVYRRCETDTEYRARLRLHSGINSIYFVSLPHVHGTGLDAIGELLNPLCQRRLVEVCDGA